MVAIFRIAGNPVSRAVARYPHCSGGASLHLGARHLDHMPLGDIGCMTIETAACSDQTFCGSGRLAESPADEHLASAGGGDTVSPAGGFPRD
jgi:hypothetical protein